MLFKLTVSSLLSRKLMAALTIISIGVSVFVLLSVEHIKTEVRGNFQRTVSGVDLIVGSRTSQLNLLLYSVFRIGNPSNNLSWNSYQEIIANKDVSWSLPFSLGDSHKGYAVLGTTPDYFEYFKFADKQKLSFADGQAFERLYQVVLGAEVAKLLGYKMGDEIIVSHGSGKVSFTHHDKHPFTVTGILSATGTPIDQTLHLPFAAIDVIHEGAAFDNLALNDSRIAPRDGDAVSAVLLGVTNKLSVLRLQRKINQYDKEPLVAVLPGLALMQLWQIMERVEISLSIVSALILFAALLGMITMLLASMAEREREIAVLRALGARPSVIILLVESEAILLTFSGCILAYFSLWLTLFLGQSFLQQEYGLFIQTLSLNWQVGRYIAGATIIAALLALIPAYISYHRSLLKGLISR
ncbi:MAG: putative ABC transport system permease protein [Paraglaciecola sp.]|jgi:putative ABC transport system permease protein